MYVCGCVCMCMCVVCVLYVLVRGGVRGWVGGDRGRGGWVGGQG